MSRRVQRGVGRGAAGARNDDQEEIASTVTENMMRDDAATAASRLLQPAFTADPFQFQLPLDVQERLSQIQAWRHQEEILYPAEFGRRKSSADAGLQTVLSMQVFIYLFIHYIHMHTNKFM